MNACTQDITLRTESGKWEYKTTVSDPLFSSIFQPLQEATGELPPELTFSGSVADIIERDWYLIQDLDKCSVELPNGEFYSLPRLFHPKKAFDQVKCILDLPTGWELYTTIDKTDPLPYRLEHMATCRDRLQEDEDLRRMLFHRCNRIAQEMICDVSDAIRGYYRQRATPPDSSLSLSDVIGPYLWNVWMGDYNANGLRTIGVMTLLDNIDWYAMNACPTVIDKRPTRNYSPLTRITSFFTEIQLDHLSSDEMYQEFYLVPPIVIYSGEYKGTDVVEEAARLNLYMKMMEFYPVDTRPETLGLGVILTLDKSSLHTLVCDRVSGIPLRHLVGRVHTRIMERVVCQTHKGRSVWQRKDAQQLIPFHDKIVTALAETVGLGVLRRMLTSLEHYIKWAKEPHDGVLRGLINTTHSVSVNDEVLVLDRAQKFSWALTCYLTGHAGEDESIHSITGYY